jgi:AAA+ superfamily predicted ATPase
MVCVFVKHSFTTFEDSGKPYSWVTNLTRSTGYSGTGKTLYAESLAKNSGKPLFKMGTSDIGFNVPSAERALKTIFELAEAWNAILLM